MVWKDRQTRQSLKKKKKTKNLLDLWVLLVRSPSMQGSYSTWPLSKSLWHGWGAKEGSQTEAKVKMHSNRNRQEMHSSATGTKKKLTEIVLEAPNKHERMMKVDWLAEYLTLDSTRQGERVFFFIKASKKSDRMLLVKGLECGKVRWGADSDEEGQEKRHGLVEDEGRYSRMVKSITCDAKQ